MNLYLISKVNENNFNLFNRKEYRGSEHRAIKTLAIKRQ